MFNMGNFQLIILGNIRLILTDKGRDKFIDVFVALKDKLEMRTLHGKLKQALVHEEHPRDANPPKHFVEKLKDSAAEATRNNMAYLQQAIGKPVVGALKALKGF